MGRKSYPADLTDPQRDHFNPGSAIDQENGHAGPPRGSSAFRKVIGRFAPHVDLRPGRHPTAVRIGADGLED